MKARPRRGTAARAPSTKTRPARPAILPCSKLSKAAMWISTPGVAEENGVTRRSYRPAWAVPAINTTLSLNNVASSVTVPLSAVERMPAARHRSNTSGHGTSAQRTVPPNQELAIGIEWNTGVPDPYRPSRRKSCPLEQYRATATEGAGRIARPIALALECASSDHPHPRTD